jgi:hypothetical protein
MGEAKGFHPEKLVLAILVGAVDAGEVLAVLCEQFGPEDHRSRDIPFDFTRYYEKEMGSPLYRLFVSFQRLVNPATLADIKNTTNTVEDSFRREGRRTVNLDPGLLSLSRFVLATTKESAHRISLHSGIYAEVTLLYKRGSFRALEWTYPDYRSAAYREELSTIRALYKAQCAPGQAEAGRMLRREK